MRPLKTTHAQHETQLDQQFMCLKSFSLQLLFVFMQYEKIIN